MLLKLVSGKSLKRPMPVEPDEPDEEFVDDFGILTQIFLEVEDVAVVKGGHDAHVVEGGGIALVVLDGVGIGVDDVGVVEHALGGRCVALQQVVHVGIHTGYHACLRATRPVGSSWLSSCLG